MKHYFIKTDNLSRQEQENLLNRLKSVAFIVNPYKNQLNMLQVFWNSNEPIEKFIPSNCEII